MKVSTRLGTLAVVVALAFLFNPDILRAQNYRGCAWPIELSPEGFVNMLAPDTLARYWATPIDNYDSMTIKGTYPNARYFSFTAYDTDPTNANVVKDAASNIYDAQILPDSGNNPFVNPRAGNGTYTVVVSRGAQTSGNTIGFSSQFAWVALRLYEPDADPSLSGQSLMGGVPLPTISVTTSGVTKELQPCSPINKLKDVSAYLPLLFPPGFDLIGNEGTPSSDRLWFAPPTVPPPTLWPNPNNKYIVMFPGDQYQSGRIIVIHGKAPSSPGGAPIGERGRDSRRNVDVRFWSVCNNDLALPVSAVGCTADLTTELEDDYYTIVISDDVLRPDWLKPHTNWLPWGDEQYPKLVFFRNMLPAANFPYSIQKAIDPGGCTFNFNLPTIPDRVDVDTAGPCAQRVMGDYYPVAAWCDKSTFIAGGFRACLDERYHRRYNDK